MPYLKRLKEIYAINFLHKIAEKTIPHETRDVILIRFLKSLRTKYEYTFFLFKTKLLPVRRNGDRFFFLILTIYNILKVLPYGFSCQTQEWKLMSSICIQ